MKTVGLGVTIVLVFSACGGGSSTDAPDVAPLGDVGVGPTLDVASDVDATASDGDAATSDSDAATGDVVSSDADATAGDGDAATDGDAGPTLGALPIRDCKTRFALTPGVAGKVQVFGEWDGFATKSTLDDGLGTGTYLGELLIPAGDWGYKFIVNDTDYRLDPANGTTRYVGGVENSRLRVGDCHAPELRVVDATSTPAGAVDLTVQFVAGSDGSALHLPDVTSLAITRGGVSVDPAAVTFDATTGKIGVHVTGLARDKYMFAVDVKDVGGRAAEHLLVPMWVEEEPFEWNDGPMYFVFTDRFRNGDSTNDAPVAGVDPKANYQGGDYAGVLASLKDGYFDTLGIKTIWLSPPNDNTNSSGSGTFSKIYSGYHGYWPVQPRAVEEHWGTLDDLRATTHEAHLRGIRVVLDLVQNQLHQEHVYYAAHKADNWFNGDGSCVCGSPTCSWDVYPVTCWFTSYLPDVNWTTMPAVDQMIDDALWWLENADADGFRVDAVKHMNEIATATLRDRVRQRFENGNARYYLVGETFTGGDDGGRALIAKYISNDRLWGQFDFPIFWGIDGAFAQSSGTMGDLDVAVTKSETSYGPTALMSPFLGNHDVTRFLSRAAGQIAADPNAQAWNSPPSAPTTDAPYDRAFLAFVFLLTQRGVPLIYYGDEIGMPGTADPDNRRMMRFGADLSAREQHLFDRVKILAKARATLPGLRRGSRTTLYTDGDGYVYARGAATEAVVVAINRGSTARTIHAIVPAALTVADGTVLHDLLGGPNVTVTAGAIDVPFTPNGASVWVR